MRTWNYSILTEKHFDKKMVDTYYTLDEEPRGQLFWVAKPFTPFQKGTQDLKNGMIGFQMMQSWAKSFNIQIATLLAFVELLYTDAYPNNYYICVSDLNVDNPIVWSTDHEEFFTEVTNEGTLEDF